MQRKLEPAVATLDRALKSRTTEGALGSLYEKLAGRVVRCFACGHRCRIPEGHDGICRVRYHENGSLRVPRGYVGALAVDPVEKKPFFHVLPGARALSFGMLGCDYHCASCQNWLTSQALRDKQALAPVRDVTAEELVRLARSSAAPILVSTYNEPLITSEWAVEVFTVARAAGILCGYVSNGNGTPEAIDYLKPHVDLYKVDLKGFTDAAYRSLGGKLDNVLDTIVRVVRAGFWVEVVTLLIPGFNDSKAELTGLTSFLASVSPDIPWHVTAFHADYKMMDKRNTSAADVRAAADIGRSAGLRYVYAGNLPGQVGELEDTRCSACGEVLVERRGYRILRNGIDEHGRCPRCRSSVPGRFTPGVHVRPAPAPSAGERPVPGAAAR